MWITEFNCNLRRPCTPGSIVSLSVPKYERYETYAGADSAVSQRLAGETAAAREQVAAGRTDGVAASRVLRCRGGDGDKGESEDGGEELHDDGYVMGGGMYAHPALLYTMMPSIGYAARSAVRAAAVTASVATRRRPPRAPHGL